MWIGWMIALIGLLQLSCLYLFLHAAEAAPLADG